MITVLFIHSAGSQGAGEGSSALLAGLRAILPPHIALLAPAMPDPEAPQAQRWQAAIAAAMLGVTGDFILVGHSLGGSSILQVLAESPPPDRLKGVVLLAAPFWSASDPGIAEYALPDTAREALQSLSPLIILQGDKDEVVPKDHPQRYKAMLPQADLRLLRGTDHEAGNAGPELLKAIESITAL